MRQPPLEKSLIGRILGRSHAVLHHSRCSISALARDIDVPPNRISEIIHGKRAITADTALRLGKYLNVSPEL